MGEFILPIIVGCGLGMVAGYSLSTVMLIMLTIIAAIVTIKNYSAYRRSTTIGGLVSLMYAVGFGLFILSMWSTAVWTSGHLAVNLKHFFLR